MKEVTMGMVIIDLYTKCRDMDQVVKVVKEKMFLRGLPSLICIPNAGIWIKL